MVRGRAGLLLGCSKTTHRQPWARSNFTPPAQFLVDKETELVGIVTIKHVENRWVILGDGDHLPFLVAECGMEEVLSGASSWPAGSTQTVVQSDYSALIFDPIAPPAIEGRRDPGDRFDRRRAGLS